jgi:rubrerythrin
LKSDKEEFDLKKMTEQNVKDALAGESQAHIRYLAFAEKAAAEKLPNVARVFRANSYSEQVHATNHLMTLAGVGTTSRNLAEALAGETFEVEEMYPAFMKVAESQDEKTALMYLGRAMAAEKIHAGIYKKARAAVDQGKDIEAAPVHVCSVCGFTMEGAAPDKCPVCASPRVKFVEF